MQLETQVWATKAGDPKWMEQLITSTTDQSKVQKATEWAEANGFDRIRTSTMPLPAQINIKA